LRTGSSAPSGPPRSLEGNIGTEVPLFAETEERRDCSFVKAGSGVRIERRGTKAGHLYDLLGHSLAASARRRDLLITLRMDAAP
jgi:hypothetical protein